MAKIKICGLKSIEDISYVNDAKADYAGFIFAENSKRCISVDIAKQMKQKLSKNIKSVGVFVNQEITAIKEIAKQKIIDMIQLHGNETNEYIKMIKEETGLAVIKAFRADENLKNNIENIIADYILIDSSNGSQFGGTGNVFDYSLIPETNKPIFLAGGLNAQNITKALKINPAGG